MHPSPKKAELHFLRISGIKVPTRTWVISHQGLHRLIQCHHHRLADAVDIARQIRRELGTIFPVIESVCRSTCPWCPAPCCIVTKVWYDFIDLLFLHLNRLPLPPAPLADRLAAPCRYLSARGCRLDRIVRPWGCLQYTCATQRRHLEGCPTHSMTALDQRLAAIRSRRHQMEAAFERGVASR
ncbi:MAG: hypothetical protein QNJ22_06025 [Desulfosarcinaceae bacterium]|nr:hypothetical protein [Desulfosarcinaceae bacterium]